MNLLINGNLFKKANKIKTSKDYILYKNKHSYFNFSKNKDFDKKTSVIVLPLNTSLNLKIGDVLVFESEHII